MLESESNQEDEDDKQNRVDVLAEDEKGELYLIEVQNESETAYFQRMLFGTSKLVTEYINRGQNYENIRKIYSVNIVYFNLGGGSDVVYHGKTEFRGIHNNELLSLSPFQKQKFKVEAVSLRSMTLTDGARCPWISGSISSVPLIFPMTLRRQD